MGRIRVLDDRLIDRIAAGEVVERPASVIKELVENSLDAGARSIEVTLERGGKRLMRIDDDGAGMDRDDVLLCLERHATSKLGSASDLEAIATLGFRGEALSSVAAVSQFTLRSATEDGSGTEVVVRGGKIQKVKEIAWPRGTSVQVERLFFNVPARRKFLRSEGTELSHAIRWLTRYALAHPEVRFRVEQGGRTLIRATPGATARDRIGEIYGHDTARQLLPVDLSRHDARVHGLAGRPYEALSRRDGQHVFVNGRAVQDRVLTHAIAEAYSNTMPKGRYPSVFLFVELDPREVDVNVHPQKTEVRFGRSSEVHDLVRDALAAALSAEQVVPRYGELRRDPDARRAAVAQATAGYVARHEEVGSVFRTSPGEAPASPSPAVTTVSPGATSTEPTSVPAPPADTLLDAMQEDDAAHDRRAVALAQYRRSYILAQDREGLLLVDQHAAHERVIFERYLEQAERDEVERQQLMFPLTVELAPDEAAILEEELPELRRIGLDLEPFGGRTVRIDGIPAPAAGVGAEPLLRELLGEAGRTRSARAGVESLRHRLVTTAACHAAIKVNYPLTTPTMQGLLDDLFRTENPSTCPHGRPALFRLGLEEIERAFRRR